MVLAVVVGLYAQHAIAYFNARSQAHEQQALVRQLVRDNAALARERAALNDPATIQRIARSLGMVRIGEHPYVISGLPKH